jgi:hypothetical protein
MVGAIPSIIFCPVRLYNQKIFGYRIAAVVWICYCDISHDFNIGTVDLIASYFRCDIRKWRGWLIVVIEKGLSFFLWNYCCIICIWNKINDTKIILKKRITHAIKVLIFNQKSLRPIHFWNKSQTTILAFEIFKECLVPNCGISIHPHNATVWETPWTSSQTLRHIFFFFSTSKSWRKIALSTCSMGVVTAF